MTIDPKEMAVPKLQALMQGVVAPRPIAFVSTIDKQGRVNLSPFSFFNMVSTNPPILVFSPSRRVRDNTTKHTLENVHEVPEVVINIVDYSMVEQASLASCDFPKGINEFEKAGFTQEASLKVKPPRVKESPASFECIVKDIIALGETGGSGNLVICEVVQAHFKDELFDESGKIDPQKLDAVARMGGDYYCRAKGESVFVVPKPNEKVGVGFDAIPKEIRNSKILTGNDLGRLANIERLPDAAAVEAFRQDALWKEALAGGREVLHRLAQRFLKEGKIEEAWKTLL